MEDLDATTWRITARDLRLADLNPDLCRSIRASILIAGPLAARIGEFKLPPPGGDVIGRRRLDTHILALQALGVDVRYERGFTFQSDNLHGADFLMDEASVTATENAIMAAVVGKGDTDHPQRCLRAACAGVMCFPESCWAHISKRSVRTRCIFTA